MSHQNLPISKSTIFNPKNYVSDNDFVTVGNMAITLENNPIDEEQQVLINNLITSNNTLSNHVDTKVQALESKTGPMDITIENDIEQQALELLLFDKNVKIVGDLRVKDHPIQCGPINNRMMLGKGLYSSNKGIQFNYNSIDDCGEIECMKLHQRHSLKLNGIDIEQLNDKMNYIESSRRIRCHGRITGNITLESTNCNITKLGWGIYQVEFESIKPTNKHYHVNISGTYDGIEYTHFQVNQDLSTGLDKFIFYSKKLDMVNMQFTKVDLTTGSYSISVSW